MSDAVGLRDAERHLGRGQREETSPHREIQSVAQVSLVVLLIYTVRGVDFRITFDILSCKANFYG